MRIGICILLAAAIVCLVVLAGCGGGNNGNNPPANTGTVTGEIYSRRGGGFVALGGQQAAIGSHVGVSRVGDGRFVIPDVPPGSYTVDVRPEPGYGVVLNPDILKVTVTKDQPSDIGRVLLGLRPPTPGM